MPSHVGVQAGIQSQKEPGDGGKARAQYPGDDDDAVGIDQRSVEHRPPRNRPHGLVRAVHVVEDYLRRPQSPQNLEIVVLLVEVDQQIRAGNYLQAEKALDQANRKLEIIQNQVLAGN